MLSTSRPFDRSRAAPRKIAIPPMRFDRLRTRLISSSKEKSSRCTRTNMSSLSAMEPAIRYLLHSSSLESRMFKYADQQRRSKRRRGTYVVRSVGLLSDARTQLAACFKILLGIPLRTAARVLPHRDRRLSCLRGQFPGSLIRELFSLGLTLRSLDIQSR